jgi:uncharacterized protein (TIGR02246 family)
VNVKMLKVIAGLSVMLAAIACAGGRGAAADASKGAAAASGPVNDPMVRAALDSMNRLYMAAFKAADAATAASFYERDAMSMAPNSEASVGRAGIEKGLAEAFKGMGKINDFTTETKDVDIYPDHAIEVGTYEMSITPPGAKAPVKDHGSFMNYWRKQPDGSWKVHRDAIVSASPMASMGPPPSPAKK